MKKLLTIFLTVVFIFTSSLFISCAKEPDEYASEAGYDIIVVAGQSNAVGNGKGESSYTFANEGKIYELCGEYNAYVEGVGEEAKIVVNRISRRYFIRLAKTDVGSAWNKYDNFALRFATEYLNNNLSPKRQILIVQTAVSGTGFAKEHWGVEEVLYERTCSMVRHALSIEGKNRVVAFLWHQGEHDTEANPTFSFNERKDYYYDKLNQLVMSFRSEFGLIPFVCAGFTKQFCEMWPTQSLAVYEAIEKVVSENRKSAFVINTNDLLSNDEKVNDGDVYHFCKESQSILGLRYYQKWIDIK